MSGNVEMNLVDDSQIPDSILSIAIDQPFNLNSDEDTNQVDYLGTTFITEDWGDDPFDWDDDTPEKTHDSGESWGEEFLSSEKNCTENNHEDAISWGDEFSSSKKMAPEIAMMIW